MFWAKLVRFRQIWAKLRRNYTEKGIRFGQNQNLASPKTIDPMFVTLRFYIMF